MKNKLEAFWVGNVVGLSLLVGGVLWTSCEKQSDTSSTQTQSTNSDVPVNPNEMTEVLVAKSDIAKGQAITPADVTSKKMKVSKVEFGAVVNVADVNGQKANRPIKKGTIINNSALTSN